MTLNEIKLRQLTRKLGDRFPQKNSSNQSGGTLQEEKKEHHTPEFVRHCVAAITEKPEDLERLKKDAPKGTNGSPFAVCWAKYKANKRSLAAKHAKGKHHSVKDYESALEKLRNETEELRVSRLPRSRIVYEAIKQPKGRQRALVRFLPAE